MRTQVKPKSTANSRVVMKGYSQAGASEDGVFTTEILLPQV